MESLSLAGEFVSKEPHVKLVGKIQVLYIAIEHT